MNCLMGNSIANPLLILHLQLPCFSYVCSDLPYCTILGKAAKNIPVSVLPKYHFDQFTINTELTRNYATQKSKLPQSVLDFRLRKMPYLALILAFLRQDDRHIT
jgi:hypothetical protein